MIDPSQEVPPPQNDPEVGPERDIRSHPSTSPTPRGQKARQPIVPPPESPEHRYFFDSTTPSTVDWAELTPNPKELDQPHNIKLADDKVRITAPGTAEVPSFTLGADNSPNTMPTNHEAKARSHLSDTAEYTPIGVLAGEGSTIEVEACLHQDLASEPSHHPSQPARATDGNPIQDALGSTDPLISYETESTAEYNPVRTMTEPIHSRDVEPTPTPSSEETAHSPAPLFQVREEEEPGIPLNDQVNLGLHEPMQPNQNTDELSDTTPLPLRPQSAIQYSLGISLDETKTSATGSPKTLSSASRRQNEPSEQEDDLGNGSDGTGDDFEDADEVEAPSRWRKWAVPVLANYASIVTLLCVYLWYSPQGRYEGAGAGDLPTLVQDTEADSGRFADEAFRITAPKALPSSAITTWNRTLKLGHLEFTPREIHRKKVELKPLYSLSNETPISGGENALWLKVEVKNTSEDQVFKPLDPSYIREREKYTPDSFLEMQNQRIYLYPIAEKSDKTLIGQGFPELKPGERATLVIISDKDAYQRLVDGQEVLWRARLRVGVGATETFGVKFTKADVK